MVLSIHQKQIGNSRRMVLHETRALRFKEQKLGELETCSQRGGERVPE